jgi:RimJ/RimL family protein N-acetyltransferase
LARHAVDDLEAQRVELRIERDNGASLAVAKRAGFTREGVLRATMPRAGRLRDIVVYSLLPSELPRD